MFRGGERTSKSWIQTKPPSSQYQLTPTFVPHSVQAVNSLQAEQLATKQHHKMENKCDCNQHKGNVLTSNPSKTIPCSHFLKRYFVAENQLAITHCSKLLTLSKFVNGIRAAESLSDEQTHWVHSRLLFTLVLSVHCFYSGMKFQNSSQQFLR